MIIKKFSTRNTLIITLVLIFTFGLLVPNKSYANDTSLNSKQITVSVTNDETGEITFLDSADYTLSKSMSRSLLSDSTVEGYDIFVPLESLKTTRDSTGQQQTSGGITAKLYVDYDVSTNNEKVRLNKIYGSWTPSSNLYYLTDRKVNAHSGVVYGKSFSAIPTANNFSYTTGWDYNIRLLGDASPRAWSSAISHISGMTATYTIKVEFTYST